MSRRPRGLRLDPAGLAVIAVGLAVIGYNLWSLCCGRCTMATFARLGPAGWTLAALVLAGWGLLSCLRRRNLRRRPAGTCPACRRRLQVDWQYCPDCGGTVPDPA